MTSSLKFDMYLWWSIHLVKVKYKCTSFWHISSYESSYMTLYLSLTYFNVKFFSAQMTTILWIWLLYSPIDSNCSWNLFSFLEKEKQTTLSELNLHLSQLSEGLVKLRQKTLSGIQLSTDIEKRSMVRKCLDQLTELSPKLIHTLKALACEIFLFCNMHFAEQLKVTVSFWLHSFCG